MGVPLKSFLTVIFIVGVSLSFAAHAKTTKSSSSVNNDLSFSMGACSSGLCQIDLKWNGQKIALKTAKLMPMSSQPITIKQFSKSENAGTYFPYQKKKRLWTTFNDHDATQEVTTRLVKLSSQVPAV